jgi:hypothetical protein
MGFLSELLAWGVLGSSSGKFQSPLIWGTDG